MQVTSAGPAIVKSVRQRQLLNTWLRLFGKAHGLPEVSAYEIDRLDDEKPDMMIYDVSYSAGTPRYKSTFEGQRLIDAFGTSAHGRFLDEVVGSERASAIIPIYDECVRYRRPAYSIQRVTDVDGTQVDYERLLLPFGRDMRVENIIAFLKPISEAGAFQQKDLMRAGAAPAVNVVNAIVDQVDDAKRVHREPAPAGIVEI
jgi:hypothetical protein